MRDDSLNRIPSNVRTVPAHRIPIDQARQAAVVADLPRSVPRAQGAAAVDVLDSSGDYTVLPSDPQWWRRIADALENGEL